MSCRQWGTRSSQLCHAVSLASSDPGREGFLSLLLQMKLGEAGAICPTSLGKSWTSGFSSRGGFQGPILVCVERLRHALFWSPRVGHSLSQPVSV